MDDLRKKVFNASSKFNLTLSSKVKNTLKYRPFHFFKFCLLKKTYLFEQLKFNITTVENLFAYSSSYFCLLGKKNIDCVFTTLVFLKNLYLLLFWSHNILSYYHAWTLDTLQIDQMDSLIEFYN